MVIRVKFTSFVNGRKNIINWKLPEKWKTATTHWKLLKFKFWQNLFNLDFLNFLTFLIDELSENKNETNTISEWYSVRSYIEWI